MINSSLLSEIDFAVEIYDGCVNLSETTGIKGFDDPKSVSSLDPSSILNFFCDQDELFEALRRGVGKYGASKMYLAILKQFMKALNRFLSARSVELNTVQLVEAVLCAHEKLDEINKKFYDYLDHLTDDEFIETVLKQEIVNKYHEGKASLDARHEAFIAKQHEAFRVDDKDETESQ
jgi:hypothetical protein